MISSIYTGINNSIPLTLKSASMVSFKAQHSKMFDSYISKSRLKTLFPEGIENAVIKQDHIPDCQLLSFIDGLIHNKKGVKILENMFKISPDGKTIDVTFPAQSANPICLDFEKVKSSNDTNKMSHRDFKLFLIDLREYLKTGNKDYLEDKTGYSPLGVRILENAYAKYCNPKLYEKEGLAGVMFDENYHCDSAICMKDIIGGQIDTIRVAGTSSKGGPHNNPLNSMPSEDKNRLFEYLKRVSQNPDSYIVTAGTLMSKKRKFTRKFAQFHDYSIRKVDYENKELTIANPWKTSLVQTIKFDEFMDNFDTISFAKI